ncbi:putative 50S ribosomal protein L12 [Cardiosporidium cionae]|uniref:50S ribosomal protein L12 n=1 Tax=Cardiosporidium cionae TaxID=476202 RepID=A0ABQ7J4V5_9APIC|nr:putative 50S ribosomal protein L12 [Cardiosporidium cionae]|eukprot:KAF8819027.1 putative 50S ribosomal protein L12 [Cardiosporidium cionae]
MTEMKCRGAGNSESASNGSFCKKSSVQWHFSAQVGLEWALKRLLILILFTSFHSSREVESYQTLHVLRRASEIIHRPEISHLLFARSENIPYRMRTNCYHIHFHPFSSKCVSQLFSSRTDEILEKLKKLTLVEAAELVAQMEKAFGISVAQDTGASFGASSVASKETENAAGSDAAATEEEQTEFAVVLESVDTAKRINVIKTVRTVKKDLTLKGAKDLVDSLPQTLLEGATKVEAEEVRKKLVDAGGVITMLYLNEVIAKWLCTKFWNSIKRKNHRGL